MVKKLDEFIGNMRLKVNAVINPLRGYIIERQPEIKAETEEIDDKRLEELFKEGKISKEVYDMLIGIKKNNK